MRNFLKLSALSLVLISLSSNSMAITTTGNASARVLTPIAVTATTPLQFGSFASGATAGTIDQSGAVAGGVTSVASTRSAGVFTVTGESSATTPYTFALPNPATVTLTSGANSMTASLTYANGGPSRSLTSGSDSVTINGSLTVAANQAAGLYSGTYTVTAVY